MEALGRILFKKPHRIGQIVELIMKPSSLLKAWIERLCARVMIA